MKNPSARPSSLGKGSVRPSSHGPHACRNLVIGKERKQFDDERACDSWAAYGQGWEDIVRQVHATTVVGAMCGCTKWQDGIRGEIRGKCWK